MIEVAVTNDDRVCVEEVAKKLRRRRMVIKRNSKMRSG